MYLLLYFFSYIIIYSSCFNNGMPIWFEIVFIFYWRPKGN